MSKIKNIRSYADASTYLAETGAFNRPHPATPTSTRVLKRFRKTSENGGEYAMAIRYHETDIVTFNPDGSIDLDTGGWFTKTTMERINNALHAHGLELSGSWETTRMWQGKTNARGKLVWRDWTLVTRVKTGERSDAYGTWPIWEFRTVAPFDMYLGKIHLSAELLGLAAGMPSTRVSA